MSELNGSVKLAARNISMTFVKRQQAVEVLRDVTVQVEASHFVSIVASDSPITGKASSGSP